MVTVALAGATTGFGLTFLRTFFACESEKRHKLVLLSRSEQPRWSSKGIDVRPVDYSDHGALVKALEGVHTVLSLIGGSAEGLRDSQIALIKAAQEAGVKRFAPSEYAASTYDGVDLYAPKAEVWDVVTKSGLEYTRFSCGLFINVLATGTPKPPTELGTAEGVRSGEEEALAGLRPWNYIINMKAGTADFPGDGNSKTVLTEMRDVAAFTIAALDLDHWPQELGMRGDVKSFREIVEIVERVQGRKFFTKENSIEDMKRQIEQDPSTTFYNQTRIAFMNGWGMVQSAQLNEYFPDKKPTTVAEFVEKWWSGVQLDESSWQDDTVFGFK